MARHYNHPSSTELLPREHLNKSDHREIDSILKSHKKTRRHLNSTVQPLQDERDIMERLYYKGKNQHSASLFWKRFTEARRYTQRLDTLDMMDLLDTFYMSFFKAIPNLEKLKGSWSFCPHEPHVALVLRRCENISELLEKTCQRLETCYKHLTLSLQSGAFAQFLVLCIAVVSRLQIYSQQILLDIQLMTASMKQLLGILKRPPGNIKPLSDNALPSPTSRAHSPQLISPPTPATEAVSVVVKPKAKRKKALNEIDAIFGI